MNDTNKPEQPLITMRNRLFLAQAARLVGKDQSCIFRWYRDGVQGVKLECLRMGRSLFTSEAALEKFGRDVAAAYMNKPRRKRKPNAKASKRGPDKAATPRGEEGR